MITAAVAAESDQSVGTCYVRLSPTVLYRTPDCYGRYDGNGACRLCLTRQPCSVNQETVYRGLEQSITTA